MRIEDVLPNEPLQDERGRRVPKVRDLERAALHTMLMIVPRQ